MTIRLFPLCLLLLAARATPGAAEPPADAPPAPSSWVAWDRRTDRVVSAPGDTGAAYPRAKQLSNGDILLAYHHGEVLGNCGARVTLRRSRDGGRTWCQTREVEGPREKGFWGFSNPDFIELDRGRVLLVSAARGKADPGTGDPFLSECRSSGLRIRFSTDYGATWGPPRLIAAGRGRVWEPAVVRLPGGELEIFYAVESPSWMARGSTQCIESVRSQDGGQTWSAPALVSQQQGCRCGVPAPLALGNGHVVCGQEVVGLDTSPWLLDTVGGQPRQARLAQDRYEFGGGPFLARAPDGGTLLAFHSQCRQTPALKQVSGSWLLSDVFVQRGDANAEHFGPASCPWPTEDALAGAFFPSLLVTRDGSLVALASFIRVRPDRTTTTVVRWVQGRLLRP